MKLSIQFTLPRCLIYWILQKTILIYIESYQIMLNILLRLFDVCFRRSVKKCSVNFACIFLFPTLWVIIVMRIRCNRICTRLFEQKLNIGKQILAAPDCTDPQTQHRYVCFFFVGQKLRLWKILLGENYADDFFYF